MSLMKEYLNKEDFLRSMLMGVAFKCKRRSNARWGISQKLFQIIM